MISLGYYLPVIAAMWLRDAAGTAAAGGAGSTGGPGGALPALAGGSPELDDEALGPDGEPASAPAATATAAAEATTGTPYEVVLVAVLAGAATIFFGVVPQPLFDLFQQAGGALGGLF
jgi:NADH-quinone oxidoreductase subunit N